MRWVKEVLRFVQDTGVAARAWRRRYGARHYGWIVKEHGSPDKVDGYCTLDLDADCTSRTPNALLTALPNALPNALDSVSNCTPDCTLDCTLESVQIDDRKDDCDDALKVSPQVLPQVLPSLAFKPISLLAWRKAPLASPSDDGGQSESEPESDAPSVDDAETSSSLMTKTNAARSCTKCGRLGFRVRYKDSEANPLCDDCWVASTLRRTGSAV
jgi:hypothetical protein